MSEPTREAWIAAATRGRSFADVGGLWGTVNEQVSVAARAGASATTMIDIAPHDNSEQDLWRLFLERLDGLGVSAPACIEASIDDREAIARAGTFDVVHCSGVLYHCPEPLHTLQQLRVITNDTLILGTASMPEHVENAAGAVTAAPGSALLVPALSYSQRAVLGQWLTDNGVSMAIGVNHPIESNWAVTDYGAWWWFFTRDYVAALLRLAGFEVVDVASYWNGRATFFRARTSSTALG